MIIGQPTNITELLEKLETDEKNDIDRQLKNVIQAVEETGQQGTVTIKYTFKKAGKDGVNYEVQPTSKAPVKKPGGRMMFFKFDDKLKATGELSETPHRQDALPLFDSSTPASKRPS